MCMCVGAGGHVCACACVRVRACVLIDKIFNLMKVVMKYKKLYVCVSV